MKELGELLKQTRETKKISLEEVSVATKISVKVLMAIEEGDLDKLPPKPFVRGFVQSYARYLGLDAKEILDLYQSAMGATQPTQMPLVETNKIEKSLPGGARNIITVTLIIITIIVIVAVQRIISKREAEMRPGEVQAITGNSEPLKITAGTPSPSSSASPTENAAAAMASASASPSTSPSPEASATPTATATATPTPAPTPVPVKKKKNLKPSPTETPAAEESPSPAASTTSAAGEAQESPVPTATPEANPQEVIVEALDKVTVKVTIDNGQTKDVPMNADQILTFKAKYKLKLYTPDGGAISVIDNGFDLGVPGNLGQPKTMVFPK